MSLKVHDFSAFGHVFTRIYLASGISMTFPNIVGSGDIQKIYILARQQWKRFSFIAPAKDTVFVVLCPTPTLCGGFPILAFTIKCHLLHWRRKEGGFQRTRCKTGKWKQGWQRQRYSSCQLWRNKICQIWTVLGTLGFGWLRKQMKSCGNYRQLGKIFGRSRKSFFTVSRNF